MALGRLKGDSCPKSTRLKCRVWEDSGEIPERTHDLRDNRIERLSAEFTSDICPTKGRSTSQSAFSNPLSDPHIGSIVVEVLRERRADQRSSASKCGINARSSRDIASTIAT